MCYVWLVFFPALHPISPWLHMLMLLSVSACSLAFSHSQPLLLKPLILTHKHTPLLSYTSILHNSNSAFILYRSSTPDLSSTLLFYLFMAFLTLHFTILPFSAFVFDPHCPVLLPSLIYLSKWQSVHCEPFPSAIRAFSQPTQRGKNMSTYLFVTHKWDIRVSISLNGIYRFKWQVTWLTAGGFIEIKTQRCAKVSDK